MNAEKEYSIGQFSLITRMTVKAIRFYHEKEILFPSRIDPDTGYRFYDKDCVERARIINTLRRMEFSVEEIGGIMRECQEDEDAVRFLKRKAEEIREKIRHLKKLEADLGEILTSAEQQDNSGGKTMIETKTLETYTAATIRYKGRYEEMGSRIGLLYQACGRWAAGPVTSLYHDGEYREYDADVEVTLPLKPGNADKARAALEKVFAAKGNAADTAAVREIPGCRALTLLHIGGYDSLGDSYQKLMDAVAQQNLKPAPPTREIYRKGPGMLFRGNPAKYRTEIQIPVE